LPYQTPVTIKKVLDQVHAREYVLPAIQREFVWKPAQICQLFDSLMRRYPIGSFLFWRVAAEHSRDFVFYEVMERYHERTHRHCDRLNLPNERPLTAILDGQQRLTALNIGLNGSHAEKLPRKWASSKDAYPTKELFLDLCRPAPDDERDMRYRFEFLEPERAKSENDPDIHWYRVRDVLGLGDGAMPAFSYIESAGIGNNARQTAMEALDRLRRTVHEELVISQHEEEDQDIDRVLNIFIRVNSGGTQLSYSDLLLSIATAQWEERDAREAIYNLVDSLNETGQGFRFSKDLVLKAGLVMTDAGDVRFKVANFTRPNMSKLEEKWDDVDRALSLAAQLLATFGFSERTLTADSVLAPIADYLYKRGADQAYVTSPQYEEDRKRIRGWVIRSLLKAGVWSSIDTLLVTLRRVIRDQPETAFPVDELQSAMARSGKSLRFDREEIEDLIGTESSKGRAFALLSLLYPGIDVRNEFHVDHVFPRSRFTPKRLEKAGIPAQQTPIFMDYIDRLPNLQLLEGSVNQSKQATLPLAWAEERYPDGQQRGLYLAGHDLDDMPDNLVDFPAFFERRKELMLEKLAKLLGADPDVVPPESVDASVASA
jgi:Protein of unknown function DUF262